MSLLAKIFDRSKSNKSFSAKLVLLGSSGAGKTTLIRFLERGKPVEEDIRTTLGIDYRARPIKIDNWEFNLIDIGGQLLYQKTFWSLGISQADAILYLFDGTISLDSPTFEENLKQFANVLKIIELEIPLLILINKQDLPNYTPAEEFSHSFGLHNLTSRSMTLLQTSAKYGDGVENAMKWLIEKIHLIS
jgi:small GTP-binding protein